MTARRGFSHYAAPLAFLAAITILVVVVRAGLRQGSPSNPGTNRTTSTQTVRSKGKKHHVRMYTVRSGDTLALIASRTGTTVVRLEQLNPRVNPTALRIGEKIRVQ